MGTGNKLIKIGDHVFHIDLVEELEKYTYLIDLIENPENFSDVAVCDSFNVLFSDEKIDTILNLLLSKHEELKEAITKTQGIKSDFFKLLYVFILRHLYISGDVLEGVLSTSDLDIYRDIQSIRDTPTSEFQTLVTPLKKVREYSSEYNFINVAIKPLQNERNVFKFKDVSSDVLKVIDLYSSVYAAKRLEMVSYLIVSSMSVVKDDCCYMNTFKILHDKYLIGYEKVYQEYLKKLYEVFNNSYHSLKLYYDPLNVLEVFKDLNTLTISDWSDYDFGSVITNGGYDINPDNTVGKSIAISQQMIIFESVLKEYCNLVFIDVPVTCIESCDLKDPKLPGEVKKGADDLQKGSDLAQNISSGVVWLDRVYPSPNTGTYTEDNVHIEEDLYNKKKTLLDRVSEFITDLNSNSANYESAFYSLQNRLSEYLQVNVSDISGLSGLIDTVENVTSTLSDIACNITKLECLASQSLNTVTSTLSAASNLFKTNKDVISDTTNKVENFELDIKSGISVKVGRTVNSVVENSVSAKVDALIDPKDEDYFKIQQAKNTILASKLSGINSSSVVDCEWLERYPVIKDVTDSVFESARENLDNCSGESLINLPSLAGIDITDLSITPRLNIDLNKPICKKER